MENRLASTAPPTVVAVAVHDDDTAVPQLQGISFLEEESYDPLDELFHGVEFKDSHLTPTEILMQRKAEECSADSSTIKIDIPSSLETECKSRLLSHIWSFSKTKTCVYGMTCFLFCAVTIFIVLLALRDKDTDDEEPLNLFDSLLRSVP